MQDNSLMLLKRAQKAVVLHTFGFRNTGTHVVRKRSFEAGTSQSETRSVNYRSFFRPCVKISPYYRTTNPNIINMAWNLSGLLKSNLQTQIMISDLVPTNIIAGRSQGGLRVLPGRDLQLMLVFLMVLPGDQGCSLHIGVDLCQELASDKDEQATSHQYYEQY